MSEANEDMEDMEMAEDDDLDDEEDYSNDSLEEDEEPTAESGQQRMTDEATDSATSTQPPQEEEATVARRRLIMAIMRDPNLTEQEKRLQIHAIMNSTSPVGSAAVVALPVPPSLEGNAVCVHYERNCSIVAPCCNRIFGCRICHDELSPAGHPPINRYLIREIVCKSCNTRQASSNQCVHCQIVFGEYHCSICNLWMSLSKKPFHCALCGLCRVGGIEAFRHCNQCCMCISVSVFAAHQCIPDKYKNACPVCVEDMFSSRQSPQDLPCGHAIHAHCFRKLAGFDYRCPLCKKTVVSQESMAAAWDARRREIEEHPMPAELQRLVDIMCVDCEQKSARRQWHFLGIQCPQCNSFNTVVEQVVSSESSSQVTRNNNSGAA